MTSCRFRPTLWQYMGRMVWMTFLSVVVWMDMPWSWRVLLGWIAALAVVQGVLMVRWQTTVASVDGLSWRGLRRRELAWSHVVGLRVEGGRWDAHVVVLDDTGTASVLPAPTTGILAWDTSFEEKWQVLQQYFLTQTRAGVGR